MRIDLIEHNNIRTQEELRTRLSEKGLNVTQATLSRDINELGILKGDYYNIERPELPAMFMQSITRLDHAGNTVVIKCRSGMASAVCAEIDLLDMKDVVGTLAGDDTIFVLMRSEQAAQLFAENLRESS